MPVKSIDPKNNKQNYDAIAKRFGYDYSNWNWMSLMRLNFWAIIITLISWIFLILGIIFSCESSAILSQYVQQNGTRIGFNNGTYNGEWGFAIFCWIIVVVAWVTTCIMDYYMIIKAKEIDVLYKTWWVAVFNFLPWIFIFVSYGIWKKELDKDQAERRLEPEDRIFVDNDDHIDLEIDIEEGKENRREKEQEQFKKEEKENKIINTSGKPLTGNKKKRK